MFDSTDFSVRFFIHVYSKSGELVVKDSVATISVPQMDTLEKFLKSMIAKVMTDSQQHDTRYDDSQSSAFTHISSDINKRVVKG